jgi:hypothetical protein
MHVFNPSIHDVTVIADLSFGDGICSSLLDCNGVILIDGVIVIADVTLIYDVSWKIVDLFRDHV